MNLKLLDDVKEIIHKNEEEINKTGKGFNLISILGMEHNERYTHSNIIAELLKADGSHTFGSKFFELFLAEVGVSDFSTTNYEVLTEEYAGQISCGENESIRTFLDIVIKDKNTGKVILIENKIWAEDQPYQIERYYDKYQTKIIKLFYLNVNEWNECPTKKDEIIDVFENISYKNQIKNWIEECLNVSINKPYIHQQIEVYKQVILKISNQNIYKKMNEEIINHIIDKDYLKEYFELTRKQEVVQFEILKRFIEEGCNIKINDSNFGNKDSFVNVFNNNDFNVDLVFEKKLANLYIKLSTNNEMKFLTLEKMGKYKSENIHTNRYFYKRVDEFNLIQWENLLDNTNVQKMRESISDIKNLLNSL